MQLVWSWFLGRVLPDVSLAARLRDPSTLEGAAVTLGADRPTLWRAMKKRHRGRMRDEEFRRCGVWLPAEPPCAAGDVIAARLVDDPRRLTTRAVTATVRAARTESVPPGAGGALLSAPARALFSRHRAPATRFRRRRCTTANSSSRCSLPTSKPR